VATALTAVGLACAAQAQPPLPQGYRATGGEIRWLYPASAAAEVAPLQTLARSTWSRLSDELGMQLPRSLELRVAVDPAQMQALAPAGRELPGYATGVALPEEGLILLSLTEPGSWLRPNMKQVLVHELSHVALQRAVGSQTVPHWFSEGVAIHQSGEHSLARVRTLWEGTLRGDLIPLKRISGGFPARHGEVDLAYAQSADVVGRMFEGRRGPARFQALIAKLREGQSFDAAFAAAYREPFDQFEHEWRAELLQRFGRWPSILSGLTLLWAAGALLLIAGYVRVRRRHHQTLKRWAIEEAPMLASVAAPPPPPPTPPPPRSAADDVLDAFREQNHHETGVPTIVHEGRSYTLH
jgi:hypothetical protein